ncbi:MAG: HD domain-containing phosphohydrolase [Candidatus Thiodiazotropha sp.]
MPSHITYSEVRDVRAAIHYCLSTVIMVLYGSRVCPFLESLTTLQLALPIAMMLLLQWVLRTPVRNLMERNFSMEKIGHTFAIEFGLFIGGGVLLAIFNVVYHGFPLDSGLKLIVGFFSLGFFVALDLALEQERKLANRFHQSDQTQITLTTLFPVSRKLGLFATLTALLVVLILFLVVNKDLLWLLETKNQVSLEDARSSILKEFLFVAMVVLAQVLNIIQSYSANLQLFFDAENSVLQRTNKGDLDGRVPVSTNDEFGLMAYHTNLMVEGIRNRTGEIVRTQDVTILSLASLAETRDNETGAHILRTQRYVRALAEQLKSDVRYRGDLNETSIDLLYKSAPLHDIGKVGIPDVILLKPGKLTDEEFDIMKTHAVLGAEAIRVAEGELGETSFLRLAREIAETHHEKWDGSGYPKGLKGEAIPLSGRLMAVADVYDALISKRVYKPAFSHDKAKSIIIEGRGGHFDPDVVDAFIAVEHEFQQIAVDFSDQSYTSGSSGVNEALSEAVAPAN